MKFSAYGLLKSDREASFLDSAWNDVFSREQDSNHHARRRPCARLLQTAAPGAERPTRSAPGRRRPAAFIRRPRIRSVRRNFGIAGSRIAAFAIVAAAFASCPVLRPRVARPDRRPFRSARLRAARQDRRVLDHAGSHGRRRPSLAPARRGGALERRSFVSVLIPNLLLNDSYNK